MTMTTGSRDPGPSWQRVTSVRSPSAPETPAQEQPETPAQGQQQEPGPRPAAEPRPAAAQGRPTRRKPVSPATVIRHSMGASLLILSLSAVGFVVWVAFFSQLHYDKAQLNAYEALRYELAMGTAPNGPANPLNANQLLAMGSPDAVLSIPAINLRTVVLEGTTSSVMENGPGHLRDTPMPGQVGTSVILGRRAAYGGPFGKLASLAPGDSITVVTGQAVSSYKVIDLRRGGDPNPPVLQAGQSRLVLVTADGPPLEPSGMLYVDADLTSKPQPAPAMVLSSANLSPSESDMGTEPSAWLPIVLWGQLLLLVTIALSWLWSAWGRWQTWLIAVPIVGYVVLSAADEVTRLLPNLM